MKPSINYNSKQELRAFLEERGLGMRKKFGQNFLINPAIRTMLLDALELKRGAGVWEIGPGLGAMTAGLLERGGRVTAFEIDPAFAEFLKESFSGQDFILIEGDVFETWPMVHPEHPNEELYLLGNLPYNIAAQVLADFIEKGRLFKRIVVTVQREVARRMAGQPGSEDYSSFSVLCSSVYKVSLLQVIKGSSFYPVPRVDSQAVRLDLLQSTEKLPVLFYPMVRSLFSLRRKKLKNTLSVFASSVIMKDRMPPISAVEAANLVLKKAGISGDIRAETLGIEEFIKLSEAMAVYMEEFSS